MTAAKTLLTRTAVLGMFCCASAQAQFLIDETFDSMGPAGTTLPTGWTAGYLGTIGTVNRAVMSPYAGNGLAITAMAPVVNDGNMPVSNVGTVLNLGTSGSTDRALGNYPRTNPSGDQIMQVAVVNNTGGSLSGVQIVFDGEQWRQAQGASTSGPELLRTLVSTLSAIDGFVYLPAFDFVAPKAAAANLPLDGNLPENRATISGAYVFPDPVANGSTFYLRWHDWNDNGTTDHFLGIDNVRIAIVPEPGALSILLVGLGAWIIRRR